MRRVVLTGAGTVNPLGQDMAQTWAALAAGKVAIGPLDLPEIDRLAIRIGAPVADWQAEARFDAATLDICDRATLLALDSARQAMAMAGLAPFADAEAEAAGVVMGTAGGGHATRAAAYRAVFAERRSRVHPFTVPRLMANAAASRIAIDQGLRGPGLTVSTACASSTHAIGLAWQMVATGQAEVMLAGGAEAMLDFSGVKVWEALRVLSPTGCHPFAPGRNGMVLGEGAAVFVLEPLDRARARGVRPLAEVAGFAMTSDAAEMIRPGGDGALRAMRQALAMARLAPGEVGHVNAHGTGTEVNDRAEAEALAALFGPLGVPVTATKASHGHLIGAGGAVEMLAVLQALSSGLVPPTAGGLAADPALAVDLVTGAARRVSPGAAIKSSFAFGGLNAVLALLPA